MRECETTSERQRETVTDLIVGRELEEGNTRGRAGAKMRFPLQVEPHRLDLHTVFIAFELSVQPHSPHPLPPQKKTLVTAKGRKGFLICPHAQHAGLI